MAKKEFYRKIKSVSSDLFNDLFMNGIDGVIILFFTTTSLMSADFSNKNIITTGMVVLLFTALIMSISAYISHKAEKEHFLSLENKAVLDAEDMKERRLLENLGIGKHIQILAQQEIEKERELWHNLKIKLTENQTAKRNKNLFGSALITGLSYSVGGMIPLLPYFFSTDIKTGLYHSGLLSLITLFIFGYFKSSSLKTPQIGGAVASLLKGALAGMGGYFIAKLFIQII